MRSLRRSLKGNIAVDDVAIDRNDRAAARRPDNAVQPNRPARKVERGRREARETAAAGAVRAAVRRARDVFPPPLIDERLAADRRRVVDDVRDRSARERRQRERGDGERPRERAPLQKPSAGSGSPSSTSRR